MSDHKERSIWAPSLLVLRPGALAGVAERTPGIAAAVWGAVSCWILLLLPQAGGGLDEPYPNWSEYLEDTLRWMPFGGVCAAVLVIPVAFTLGLYSLEDDVRSVVRRCFLLSTVPLACPAIVLLPFHVMARARDNVFLAPPKFPVIVWILGSDWWLLTLFVGWILVFFGAVRTLRVSERRMARGHCVRCGYDVAGMGMCPECGSAQEEHGPAAQSGV